jgi:hypothetical protein
MTSATATQVWMPLGAAARTAPVAARTLFRWARGGKVPVRVEGKTRLVELNALRTYAARPRSAIAAQSTATEIPAAPAPSPEAFAELVHRVERLECTLALPPPAPEARGVPGGTAPHAPADPLRGPA